MSTAALKRELALLRSSLAALTPAQSTALDDPIDWAERIAELTLDPWQRDVLLSAAPRLLLNATRQSGKSTVAALKAAWTVLQGGLAVVVSPSLRQSGFLFRKLARHLVASEAAFRRETLTEVELASGGLAVRLPGDRPAMLRGLSLRHDGPAVLIVDEAARVRDELWATISPMLAAAPAAQQILLSTRPAPVASSTAPGPRAKTGNACRSPPINARAFPLVDRGEGADRRRDVSARQLGLAGSPPSWHCRQPALHLASADGARRADGGWRRRAGGACL